MILNYIVDEPTLKEIFENGNIKPIASGNSHFIHCCLPGQVNWVLEKWFQEKDDLYVVKIDTNLLDCRVVFENLEGGEQFFPHIYGTVPVNAIKNHYQIVRRGGIAEHENED